MKICFTPKNEKKTFITHKFFHSRKMEKKFTPKNEEKKLLLEMKKILSIFSIRASFLKFQFVFLTSGQVQQNQNFQ